jgi:hypothetical protein
MSREISLIWEIPAEALAETAVVRRKVTGDFLWHLQEV